MDIAVKILLIIYQVLSFAELQSSAFEGPKDIIAYVGNNVTMRCAPGSNGSCSVITWNRRDSGSTSYKSIFKNNYLIKVDTTRYSVDNTTFGCHMIIRNIQYNDSGRYSCEAVLPNKNTETKEGFLIVLKSSPECKVHLPPASNDSVVEGDAVTFTCESTYEGAEGNMTWKGLKKGENAKAGNTYTLSYSIVAGSSGIPSLVCEIRFTSHDKATDVNSLRVACQTPPVEVLFSVRNVRLSPLSSAFSPGSVVTCQADGNPPPTIRWQSLNTQNVSTWRDIPEANGSQLIVGSDVHVRYRCVASNFVRNSSDSEISCQIAAGETGEHGYSTAVTITIGFVAGFLAAVVLLFVAWFVHKRLSLRQSNDSKVCEKDKSNLQ